MMQNARLFDAWPLQGLLMSLMPLNCLKRRTGTHPGRGFRVKNRIYEVLAMEHRRFSFQEIGQQEV
jgi:hypothetical protein